jgi:hypothetical protein
MRDNTRLLATLVVWTALVMIIGIIGGVLVATGADLNWLGTGAVVLVVLMLIAMVGVSMEAIWKGGETSEDELRAAKTKRVSRTRMERLIEALDDNEIYDLEALLLARDEERHREDRA